MSTNWKPGETFVLKHCDCFFGFDEPVKFVQHKDGGYFASVATGEHVFSTHRYGYKCPNGVEAVRSQK